MSETSAKRLAISTALMWLAACSPGPEGDPGATPGSAPPTPGLQKNVVLVLVDDHRYDAMGFMGHPYLETPHLDALAAQGVHFRNAFVTTSLCSPSRASILTGLYTHHHGVVSNNDPMRGDLETFPQILQGAGYQTGFVGKWHMGGSSDEPRPGFDHWVSFRGQGVYLPPPPDRGWSLNVNGESVPQKGYITDELTDYALDWLDGIDRGQPFLLYLSHKAVHAEFTPAERHAGTYAGESFPVPTTQPNTPENYEGRPRWVLDQRNSWHGVDYPYHGRLDDEGGVERLYGRYIESLLAVDDSVGRVRSYLENAGLADDTVVIYLGDNGFLWGEHGLIDKRNAYEESMRIPMMAWGPSLFEPGTEVDSVVANIDVGPSILELAGLPPSETMDGSSFVGLATGAMAAQDWRESLLYEYYWEWNFPQTPTVFALREDRFKLIQYHGIWDLDELYDVLADPLEQQNLIDSADHAETVFRMRAELHERLAVVGANRVPFSFKRSGGQNKRSVDGPPVSPFPDSMVQ